MKHKLRPARVGFDNDGDGHFDQYDAYCRPGHPDAKFYYIEDVEREFDALTARLAEAERLLQQAGDYLDSECFLALQKGTMIAPSAGIALTDRIDTFLRAAGVTMNTDRETDSHVD